MLSVHCLKSNNRQYPLLAELIIVKPNRQPDRYSPPSVPDSRKFLNVFVVMNGMGLSFLVMCGNKIPRLTAECVKDWHGQVLLQ